MADHVRRVAVLGTGTMGAPMARNLLHAGFGVRVWNRTTAKAATLAADGTRPASDPAEAAAGADVLITMLADGATVEDTMTGPDGALSMLSSDAIWIQMSTVGVEWTDRLADLADRHGVAFVDAPVSGSSEPADRGELEILAAGALEVRPRVQPIFDVLGRRTVWLDRVGEGSRLKLALNNWLVVLVEAMCETLTFSEALGLEPHVFLEAIAGGPLASAYAMAKGTAMLDEDFVPGFPLRHAVKTPSLPRALPAGMGCNSRSLMRCCRAGVKPSSKATVTRTPPRPLPAPPRPPVARHEPDFDRHVTISEDAASRVAKNAKYLGVSEQIAPILSDRTVVQLKSSATH